MRFLSHIARSWSAKAVPNPVRMGRTAPHSVAPLTHRPPDVPATRQVARDQDFAPSADSERPGTIDFPRHLRRPGKVVRLDGQRGRVITSVLDARPHEVGTQTAAADAHCHLGPGYSPTQVFDFSSPFFQGLIDQIALMDAAGIEECLCMGIPTNIEGGPQGCCGNDPTALGHTYYMPDALRDNREPMTGKAFDMLAEVGQYYNTSVDWQLAKAWRELPADLQRRILLSVTALVLNDPHGVHLVMRLQREYPGVFCWMGESTGVKEGVDRQHRTYRPDFSPQAPVHAYLAYAARAGMGFTLHCDVSDAGTCIRTGRPGKAEHLESIKGLFAAHPDTTIVWAHLGGLGKYSPPARNHEASLREVLEASPNVCIDMSWNVVAEHYSPHPGPACNMSDRQRAAFDPASDAAARQQRIRALAALIEAYPDRFVMGSDALIPRSPESLTSAYAIYSNFGQGPGTATPGGERRALFDHLSPDTIDKVMRGNFLRLYGQAREACRRYEAEGLLRDMEAIQEAAVRHGRTPNNWPS